MIFSSVVYKKIYYYPIFKISLILCRNKVFLIVEFVILLFSGIFTLTIASILTSGWEATCKSKDAGTYCHDSFAEEVTAAVVSIQHRL